MLGEVALATHFVQLRLGFGQLVLRAGQVQFRRNLAFITAAGQLQRLAVVLQRRVEDSALCIQPIELHIQARQLLLQAQAHHRQIIKGRLRLGIACSDLVADSAPQVEVVTQGEPSGIAVVHRRLCSAA